MSDNEPENTETTETPVTPVEALNDETHTTTPPTPENASETPTDAPEGSSTVFTQQQVDEIVQKRIARETAKHQAQLDALVAEAKQQATAELTEKVTQLEEQARTYQHQLLSTQFTNEVTVAALKEGTQPDQVEAFTKLITVSEVTTDEGTIDPALVETAVKQVVAKFPGLTTVQGVGGAVSTASTEEPLSLADAIAKKMGKA